MILSAVLIGLLGAAVIAVGHGNPGYDGLGGALALIAVFFLFIGVEDLFRKGKKK